MLCLGKDGVELPHEVAHVSVSQRTAEVSKESIDIGTAWIGQRAEGEGEGEADGYRAPPSPLLDNQRKPAISRSIRRSVGVVIGVELIVVPPVVGCPASWS